MSLIDPILIVNMPAQSIFIDGYDINFHPIEWKNFVEKLPEEVHSEYDRLHVWYGYENRAEVEKFRWNPVDERLEHYNVPKEVWTSEIRERVFSLCKEIFDAERDRQLKEREALREQLNAMAAAATPSAIHTNSNETSLGGSPVYGGVTISEDQEFQLYSYLQDFIKYQLKDTDYVFNPDVNLSEDHKKWYSSIRNFWRKANYLLEKRNIIPFCASVERPNHPNDPLLVIPTAIGCKLHSKLLVLFFKYGYSKIWNAFETQDLNKLADLTNVWCRMALEYDKDELSWAYFPQLEFLAYVDPLSKEIEKRDSFMTKDEMMEFFENNKDKCLEKVKSLDFLSRMPVYEDFISITPVENLRSVIASHYRWIAENFGEHIKTPINENEVL